MEEKSYEKLKWLEQICSKYGENFCWPPYPRELIMPDFIQDEWIKRRFDDNIIRILRMDNYDKRIHAGDRFNAIIHRKKRKKGLKKSQSTHRILQFVARKDRMMGKIVYDDSIYGGKTIKKGEIMSGRVHKVEVIQVDYRKRLYYCIALAKTFNKNNLLDNLVNCYYEAFRDKKQNP